MCIISMNEEKIRYFFDVLFVLLSYLDQEKSPFFWYGGWPLVSILKPRFHCDAKPLALGPGVGLDPQRHNFVLGIPTCWYLKNAKICFTPNAKPKICVSPNAKPQCKSVEYRLRWVFWRWGSRWAYTFQVVCINFICVWWPTQTQFSVEYGLTITIIVPFGSL